MGVPYTLLLSVFYLASGIFIFLLGLTILRTGRSNDPTRATALILFFAGLGPILSASSIILQSTLKQDAVVYRSMVENFEYLWEFYFPSLLLFAMTYLRQDRFLGNFAVLGLFLFAPYLFHLVTIMAGNGLSKSFGDLTRSLPAGRELSLGEQTLSLSGISNIIAAVFATLVKLHKQLFLLVNILYAAIAIVFLSRSMRLHINPRITGQLRTVLAGLTVSVAGYSLAKLLPLAPAPFASENVSLALTNFALVAGGGSVAYAVIKQQLLGIKYVTRKSILYGAAALLFAGVYLMVVKPVSDFFGQYSLVSKDAFETGFIILTIIAFQPMLLRIEELLEQKLLKGRDDLQTNFRKLGSEISDVTNGEELETLLQSRFRDILDASAVRLEQDSDTPRYQRMVEVLERIGGPVMRHELLRLGETGRLGGGGDPVRAKFRPKKSKKRSKEGLSAAQELVGGDEVFVPILKERKCVGIVSLGEKTYKLRYSAEELALLSVVSNQIGAALDNIRLLRENVEKKVLEEELQIARRIQSQLLPSASPDITGYELWATTIPSRHVGGDYYYFEILDSEWLIVVCADVSGKGIPASLLMATLHAAVNSNQDAKRRPSAMLRRMNALLYASTSDEEFATIFYGVVDTTSGEMRYANAGHEFPFIVSQEGLHQLAQSGIVLGCMEDYHYEEQSCSIPRGGSLILYTDGITDAATAGGEPFGEARLRRVLEANPRGDSRDLCENILSEVRRFSTNGEYQDDLTLVVVRRD